MRLGTKAETLKRLAGKLPDAHILPQVCFTAGEYGQDAEKCWEDCCSLGDVLIVRSSALNEDTAEHSQAGKFESVGNVKGRQAFREAVDEVIKSYDDDNPANQILVQPMLGEVAVCGVAFTLDPNSLGNYYVINYDESGSTSAVTSGSGGDGKLLYVFKGRDGRAAAEWQERLCKTLSRLEQLFGQDNLDVEFAVTPERELYLFQVRALCIKGRPIDYDVQLKELERVEEKIRRGAEPKPYLCGDRSIYGIMPDWNPAEMIGVYPKALAKSLYEELITDNVWAYQRDNYGYRNLRSFPLMVEFGGLPYIDVRVSFNSFIPAQLEEDIGNKLVNYYLDRLAAEPAKHDKVEFDIVFSCYTFNIAERIGVLREYGFTDVETGKIVDALRDMTNRIINPSTGLWRKDYEKIKILERRYREICESGLDDVEKVYWLIEDCKRYGTLPFAGLARGAFIAVQLLHSMVETGIISARDYQNFMNDVHTISSDMGDDYAAMSEEDFLEKYGHLRPGTYDINSLRYDEAPDLYFDWQGRTKRVAMDGGETKFALSLEQLRTLQESLLHNGLDNDILGLMDFIKAVIEGREYGKFVFSRSVSKVLQLVGEIGARCGLTRQDCAYLNIQAVKSLYASTRDAGKVLGKSVEEGRADYEVERSLVLPPVIIDAGEVWGFDYPDTEPNYIIGDKARGRPSEVGEDMGEVQLDGRIVLIRSADPGYDWIFSHDIKGFITMWGGVNSHMAIRAGELGIPAVIGVGQRRFDSYREARMLEIDTLARNIRIL